MEQNKEFNKLYQKIEKYYFNEDYDNVISEWEKSPFQSFQKKAISDDNIKLNRVFQALIISYSQKQDYTRSNECAKAYLERLLECENKSWKDIDFCFMAITSNYSLKKKWLREYRSLMAYTKIGGGNKKILQNIEILENQLYKNYRKYNLYFAYVFITIIVIVNILRLLFNMEFDSTIMLIFSFIGVFWIVLNWISNNFSFRLFKIILEILY